MLVFQGFDEVVEHGLADITFRRFNGTTLTIAKEVFGTSLTKESGYEEINQFIVSANP